MKGKKNSAPPRVLRGRLFPFDFEKPNPGVLKAINGWGTPGFGVVKTPLVFLEHMYLV